MVRSIFVAFLALLAFAGPAAAIDDPVAFVREVYRVQAESEKNNTPVWFSPHREKFFTRRISQLLVRDEKKHNVNFDFIYDGQDFKISELTFVLVKKSAAAATVEARFKNFDEPKRLTYSLVREGGVWKIADISSRDKRSPWVLSKLLAPK